MLVKRNAGRIILHVDMNSFYASVEVAFNPDLKGKPLAIGGRTEERKGIIVTCSYEARAIGVKAPMPVWQAKRICPELIVIPPNFERYRNASLAMFDLLREYTHLVEPVSIDEGYVDLTEYKTKDPVKIAGTIQTRLLEELSLPSSIGIAPNKFLAKMASDMKKPLGITILRKRELHEKLWPLSVGDMHGVGGKTAEKLHTIGIKTIKDLAEGNDIQLKQLLGINGERLKRRANGIDDRSVDPDSIYDFKSVGNQTTLPKNIINARQIEEALRKLAASVSARLKKKGVMGTRVFITIRYHDRRTITRSRKLDNPIVEADVLYSYAKQLFDKNWDGGAIRLLGITAQDLVEKEEAVKQLDLFSFEKDAKDEPLLHVIEKLNSRYGKGIIKRGMKVGRVVDNTNGTSFNKDFLQE
ncbi:DNA polymerase IV [Metabacillus fastidiosus]|uniref:DNA polymerase IV n=1 Tax=Metabacillus fastidiosus TaxID=1458 RepID=A0ABU6NUK9_9BACI|nr:DNA polymerase IV [Metabacillus fastidiosus]MED4400834.1 DNA polymerase IV [Metabacillus fastidiosus]MED4463762.1 DNA polymerase IV [Metabacillus fastidiosus]